MRRRCSLRRPALPRLPCFPFSDSGLVTSSREVLTDLSDWRVALTLDSRHRRRICWLGSADATPPLIKCRQICLGVPLGEPRPSRPRATYCGVVEPSSTRSSYGAHGYVSDTRVRLLRRQTVKGRSYSRQWTTTSLVEKSSPPVRTTIMEFTPDCRTPGSM